jgi:hypothetical protein
LRATYSADNTVDTIGANEEIHRVRL